MAATVDIAAAMMAATSSPETPVGRWCMMNQGKTSAAFMPSGTAPVAWLYIHSSVPMIVNSSVTGSEREYA